MEWLFTGLIPDPWAPPEPPQVALRRAVGAELGVDPWELASQALAARSLRLREERDRLEVAIALTDANFEKRRAFLDLEGSWRKASQWLAAQRRIPRKVARAAYRDARRLVLLPVLANAVIAGTVTLWHLRTVAKVCSDSKRARLMADCEAEFVDAAQELDGRGFASAVAYWDETNFADEAAEAAERRDRARRAVVGRGEEDVVGVKAGLDPLYGTAFLAEHERLVQSMFRRDWAAAKAVHGESTTEAHLARTGAQRRADAMVAMAIRSATLGSDTRQVRPLITVLADWERTEGRLCELEDGTHVVPDQLLAMLGVADIERAVMTPDRRVEVSEKARLFTGATRRALELRDRFCVAPGCEMPAAECEGGHEDPFADGGPTRQANGRMECPDDHPNRRRPADQYQLPWEHTPDTWDDDEAERGEADLEAEFADVALTARTQARRMGIPSPTTPPPPDLTGTSGCPRPGPAGPIRRVPSSPD